MILLLGAACSDDGTTTSAGARAELDEASAEAQIRQVAHLEAERGRDEQAALLADGVVTEAEFRQATMRTVECFEQEGLEVSELWRVEGIYTWRWDAMIGPSEGMSVDEANQRFNDCSLEHQLGVLKGWNLMSRWQYREEVRPMIGRCLVDAGVDVPLPRSQEHVVGEDADALDVVIGCEHQTISLLSSEGLPTE